MNEGLTGGCRCGAVLYHLVVEALPRAYACHCHQCQRWTGSAFSLNAIVPESILTVSGPLEVCELTTEDRVSTQRFCAECRSRVFNTNTRRPGFAVLRAGTLDRSEELVCVAHIYVDSKQSWFVIPDGTPSWPQAAPPEDFVAVLLGDAEKVK